MNPSAWRASATRILRAASIINVDYDSTVTAGQSQTVTFDYEQDLSANPLDPDFCLDGVNEGRKVRFKVVVDGSREGESEECIGIGGLNPATRTVDVAYTAPDSRGEYPVAFVAEFANSGEFISQVTDTLRVEQPGDECIADDECGPDERCVNGQCVSTADCSTDADCGPDEVCIDGTCFPEQGGGQQIPWPLLLLVLAGGGGVALYYLTGQNDDERLRDIEALENN